MCCPGFFNALAVLNEQMSDVRLWCYGQAYVLYSSSLKV